MTINSSWRPNAVAASRENGRSCATAFSRIDEDASPPRWKASTSRTCTASRRNNVIGKGLGRLCASVGATAAITASIVAGGAAAATAQSVASQHAAVQEVGAASLHRTWACTVPSGYTWSSVRSNPNCGFRYEYFLLDAVNYNLTGVWACGIPSGYTYTSVRQGSNCSASPGSSPYEYRLARL
jgi:hypothetical protein